MGIPCHSRWHAINMPKRANEEMTDFGACHKPLPHLKLFFDRLRSGQ